MESNNGLPTQGGGGDSGISAALVTVRAGANPSAENDVEQYTIFA
jgi:hypothetical protein